MKTEKQLTAVEWLCNEWLYLDQQFDMCLIDRNIYWDKLRQIQEQAKEMDEQKMINALIEFSKANFDIHTGAEIRYITNKAEQYYNEQFKQQEQ